MLMSIIY